MVHLWLPFGYHDLYFCNYFVCTYFFVDVCHMIVVYLEIYTHKRSYISIWYLISLESTIFLFCSLVTPKRICPMSVCLILLHLVHSFVIEYFCLSCLPWWACWFLCLVEPCLMLHSSVGIFYWCSTIFLFQVPCFTSLLWSLALVLCSKRYLGSDDSIFVHFVFKCKNSK